MRLIDADALLKLMKKKGWSFASKKVIEYQRTVEAEAIPDGHWYISETMINFGYIQEYLTCSVCESRFAGECVDEDEWKYCPVCGRKVIWCE